MRPGRMDLAVRRGRTQREKDFSIDLADFYPLTLLNSFISIKSEDYTTSRGVLTYQ